MEASKQRSFHNSNCNSASLLCTQFPLTKLYISTTLHTYPFFVLESEKKKTNSPRSKVFIIPHSKRLRSCLSDKTLELRNFLAISLESYQKNWFFHTLNFEMTIFYDPDSIYLLSTICYLSKLCICIILFTVTWHIPSRMTWQTADWILQRDFQQQHITSDDYFVCTIGSASKKKCL